LEIAGDPSKRYWLVNSWAPRYVSASTLSAPTREDQIAAASRYGNPQQLGAAWLFLPLGLISLAVLVPACLLLRNWRRGRRAMAAYRRGLY
jgi:hypothetical protein